VKILAYQDDNKYLIDDSDKLVVFDTEIMKAHPVISFDSVLARGYWKDESEVDEPEKLAALIAYKALKKK
jgi:hypothetical protein